MKMSNDYSEDLMPRNVPKPTPLIEVAAKPFVPEVSLLLDQEKNKSFHHITPVVGNTEEKSRNHYNFNGEKNKGSGVQTGMGMFNVDHFESYNNWRAKNAHALHNITGSLGRSDAPTKHSVNSRNSNGERNKETKSKEFYCPQGPEVNASSPTDINQTSNTMCSSEEITAQPLSHPTASDHFAQKCSCNFDEQHSNHPSKPLYDEPFAHNHKFSQSRDNEINTQTRNIYQFSTEPQSQGPNCLTRPVQIPHCNIKDIHAQNMHPNTCMSNPCRLNIKMPILQQTMPYYYKNNTNQCQCCCNHKAMEIVNREPKEFQNNNFALLSGKVESPLNMVQINNQTVMDLYNIIHMQNEQILMLQVQVKQVLQIHLDCDRNSLKQNLVSHNCSCESKNDEASNNISCKCKTIEKTSPVESKVQKKGSSSDSDCNNKPKRPVGIMTSPTEEDDNGTVVHGNVTTNSKTVKSSFKKSKNERQRQLVYIPPSSRKSRASGQQELPCRQDKRKSQFVLTSAQKTNREEINRAKHLNNSFSLNEADLVNRTDAEQNDASPNNSAQIDLPDYCISSSSIDSDGTASSSNEEGDTDLGTEGDASEPQLGWTFYNKVVGRVNNILKKNPIPPRKEFRHMSRRNLPIHLYNVNGEYDTENNWSKRVTFDGPPDQCDHVPPHMMYLPRSNPAQLNHEFDYRPGGPNRMQDFMMYNIADGNSNLSFAALRCQDRYNTMPQYPGNHMPEHMYPGYLGSTKTTNRKFRNPDLHPQMPAENHKKRPAGPSSKLLDLTAIRQQPKLF